MAIVALFGLSDIFQIIFNTQITKYILGKDLPFLLFLHKTVG